VGRWVEAEAKRHAGFTNIELVDLAVWNLPFMNEPHHPRLGQYVHQHTRDWSTKIAETDAFVFAMPEYNFGYNAPLKNAIDYLHTEWLYKPVGFASYGGVSAGTRAVQMIKQIVTAVKMVAVYEAVSIPFVPCSWPRTAPLHPTTSWCPRRRTCSMSCAGCAHHFARYATRNNPSEARHRRRTELIGAQHVSPMLQYQLTMIRLTSLVIRRIRLSFIVAAGGSPPGDTSCGDGSFCSKPVVAFSCAEVCSCGRRMFHGAGNVCARCGVESDAGQETINS
jgi:NAD(P)H-dependent FMN reductase